MATSTPPSLPAFSPPLQPEVHRRARSRRSLRRRARRRRIRPSLQRPEVAIWRTSLPEMRHALERSWR